MQTVRSFVPYVVLVAFLAFAACLHLSSQANGRLRQAQQLEEKGNLVEAIERYEWSIQSYTPFNRSTRKAIRSLERLAENAESSSNPDIARQAWQAIVSGLAVIRHLRQPYPEELEKAERRLKSLEKQLMKKRTSKIQPTKGTILEVDHLLQEALAC